MWVYILYILAGTQAFIQNPTINTAAESIYQNVINGLMSQVLQERSIMSQWAY